MDRRRFLRGAGDAVVAVPVLALGLGSIGVSEAVETGYSVGYTGAQAAYEAEDNEINWKRHRDKIADPLRELDEAVVNALRTDLGWKRD